MNLKKLYLSIIILFIGISSFSQKNVPSKIIYLKDGSYLKGTILETMEDGSLNVELFNGSHLLLESSLISHVKTSSGKRTILTNGFNQKAKGIYYGVHLNFLPAKKARQEWVPEARRYGFGGHVVAGYRFHRLIGVGAGIGFDGYGDYMVPFFAEVNGILLKKRFSPVYNFQIGHGVPVGGEPEANGEFVNLTREGGMMIYPSIGLRMETRRNVAFVFDIGVKLQNLTKTRTYNWGWWVDPNTYIDDVWYRSLTMRFGWSF